MGRNFGSRKSIKIVVDHIQMYSKEKNQLQSIITCGSMVETLRGEVYREKQNKEREHPLVAHFPDL